MTSDDDYDRLSKEEREKRDKEDRAREEAEQASQSRATHCARMSQLIISLALPYKWSQELGEVDITVPVPQGTRGKDLVVEIKKKNLKVGLKGQEPILDGDLCKEIKVDDSTWTLRKHPMTWYPHRG